MKQSPLTDEQRQALRKTMVEDLSREQHLTLIMHHYECMTRAEIALALEVTESRVTTLLNQARTKMRAVFRQIEREHAQARNQPQWKDEEQCESD